MARRFLVIVACIVAFHYASGQNNKSGQKSKSTQSPVKTKKGSTPLKPVVKPDSLKGREQLANSLAKLRDSIASDLKLIAQKIDTAKSNQHHLDKARKRLIVERKKIDTEIENVAGATKETWEYFIRQAAEETSYDVSTEYNKIFT